MTEEVIPYNAAELPPLAAVTIAHPGDGDALLARGFLARAIRTEVVSAETYQSGAELLMALKTAKGATDEKRRKLKKPLDIAVQAVQDMFNPILSTLEQAEGQLKTKLNAYDEEQRRKAAEEQRRLQAEADRVRRETEQRAAEARRKAEADAAEIRRKAEQEAAEVRRRAQEEAAAQRRAAEAAAAAGRAEEARRLQALADQEQALAAQRAQQLEARAEDKAAAKVERAEERAEVLEQQAVAIVAPVVQVATPAVKGLSRRENWVYRTLDITKVKPEFMILDDAKVGKLVRAVHKDAEAIVGLGAIEVYPESGLGARKG